MRNCSNIFLILAILVLFSRIWHSPAQLIDDEEEDESVEDETPEEKATRKSIKEDSNLSVVRIFEWANIVRYNIICFEFLINCLSKLVGFRSSHNSMNLSRSSLGIVINSWSLKPLYLLAFHLMHVVLLSYSLAPTNSTFSYHHHRQHHQQLEFSAG